MSVSPFIGQLFMTTFHRLIVLGFNDTLICVVSQRKGEQRQKR